MQRQLIPVVFLLATLALGQQKPAAAKPASAASKPASTSGLPSEEAVNCFIHQTFGYEPQVTWKIISIKPTPAEGLSEVQLILTGPQGPQSARFYVTADGKHAVAGELMPFGVKPFAATARELEKT